MLLLFLFFYRLFRERINLNGVQPYPKARSENQKAYSYIPYIIPERLKQLHAMKRMRCINKNIIILSENIEIIFIPPYMPEMNPIEQIWKEIRKCGFKNEVFKTHQMIIDRFYDTICSLSYETIKSITERDRILFIV